MNKKRNITLMISMFITLLLITITLSFAYFTANISGTETGTTITVGAGTMNITYTNNTEVITASDIYPKNDPWRTKKFTVQGNNTTKSEMAYSAYLIMEENTFSNSALSYTLDSSNTNSNGEVIDEISENIPLSTGNSINHLGNWWWASTPSKFDLGVSNVFHVYSDGRIAGTTASMPGSLRPAISLKSNTKIVGLGTSLNPYVVD